MSGDLHFPRDLADHLTSTAVLMSSGQSQPEKRRILVDRAREAFSAVQKIGAGKVKGVAVDKAAVVDRLNDIIVLNLVRRGGGDCNPGRSPACGRE